MQPEFILINKKIQKYVAHIQLNRPKELNALNHSLMTELLQALQDCDQDDDIRVVVLSGNEKSFAAGADIKEMADKTTTDMYREDRFLVWDGIKKIKKPIIAAVSGFALGGGCELCLMCDMIIASETAQFGQPEIKIGVIPGAGGTQRLTRTVGKVRAMEMILTGKFISAEEALQAGLINKIVPVELYLEEAIKLASVIAKMPPLAVKMAKESILKSYDTNLEEGLYQERKNFYMLFSTHDQKEGMKAFIEKRKPEFTGE